MNNDREKALETLLERELKKLPDLAAPQTIIPRVLAAIQAKARPWWQRPWVTWPWGLRVLFLFAVFVVLGGVVHFAPQATHGISPQPLLTKLGDWMSLLAPVWKP